MCLLAFPPAISGKEKVPVTDSVLFETSMRLYDSLQSPSFPKMYRDALKLAQEAESESYYITFRRMLISKYFIENEQDKFIEESDRLIALCQESGTDDATRLLYEIWNTKADRLNVWNREEMWKTV